MIVLADCARVFDLIAGMVMLGLFLKVARDVRNTRQFGMFALVCFGISAITTSIERFGEYPNPQLPFNVAGVVLGCIFLAKTEATKRLNT